MPRRRKRHFLVIGTAMLSAVTATAVVAVTAMATTSQQAVEITTVAGSIACPADARAGSFVLPSVANGNYDNGWIDVTKASSTRFDWALTPAGFNAVNMAAVIVQGGGNSAVYTYDYLMGGADDSGSGLAAPGGSAITKVEFCLDDKLLHDIAGAGGGSAGATGPADLAVTGIVNPTVAKLGETILWRLNVLDKNNLPATSLKLSVSLAGGVEYASSQSDRGSGCKPDSATKITCDLDYLSADSPIGSVILLTRVVDTGDHSLTAVASHSQPDAQPSDDTLLLKASTPVPPRSPSGDSSSGALTITTATPTVRSLSVAKGKVTFRTTIRLSKPSKLAVTVMDQPATKRLTLLAGSSLGSFTATHAVKALSATSRATTVRIVVVVPLAQLVRGHRVVLDLEGTPSAGKHVRLKVPLLR